MLEKQWVAEAFGGRRMARVLNGKDHEPCRSGDPMRPCDESLAKTLKMAETMLSLADEGDGAREDVGCGILYGVLRDSAYKIRRLAEQEREAHLRKGWWRDE
jgi:hypothetical protein